MKQGSHLKQQAPKSANPLTEDRIELQRQVQAKKDIEQKLIAIQWLHKTILRHIPYISVAVINRDMKFGLVDGRLFSETNFTLRDVDEANEDFPVFDETALAKIKKAFDGESVYFELRYDDKFFMITVLPITGIKSTIDDVLCVVVNMTNQKQMESELLRALERERELGELKSRFVTMASHEFRTPLTSILASTFVLENYKGPDYEKEKLININRIKRSVNNLTTILNEFLSLQKLEENKVKLVYTEINVPEYIQDDLIGEIEVLKRPGQEIAYRHLTMSVRARLDHQVLWSIVTNLLSNALKYSKPGDKIRITSAIKDNNIELIVEDPGIGIPEAEHKYIFGRFYRASNAVNIEGTGLGLHIVQKYVQLLQGTITFESQLNKGTRFKVTLPIVQEGVAKN
jgi:signal transduction histidine kinase